MTRLELTKARRTAICIFLCLIGGSLGACGSSSDHSTTQAAQTGGQTSSIAPQRVHRPQPAADPIALSSLRGRLAFTHGSDIWAAMADGSQSHRLTSRQGPELDPSWSPDGSRIVYRDSRRGLNANDELYVMDSDGLHQRNLTRSPENEWSPSWSPDGRLIAFYSGRLYVVRPDGTGRHPITKIEGEYPAWSPDGRRLAFMSAQENATGPNPNYDVFVVNRDGSGLRQLTDWSGEDGWPSWSPDGEWIAFTTTHNRPIGNRAIWVMRPDGSAKRRIAIGEFPDWSPHPGVIIFSTTGGANDHLRVIRPDGTGLRKLPIHGWLADLL